MSATDQAPQRPCRPGPAAQGGSAADHRPCAATSTTSRCPERCGRRSCARPRRTPRSSRSTPPRRPRAHGDARRLHRRGHVRPGWPAADGVGSARASRSTTPTTGRWPEARSSTSAIPSRSVIGDDRYAVHGRRRGRDRRIRPAAGGRRPEAALAGAPFVHEQFGTNKVHEWSLAGGDVEAGFARGRRHRRAARGQPPHRRRSDRTSRRAGRLPGRLLTLWSSHPGPALRPAVHGAAARPERGPRARDRARGRRRLRLQAPGLRRGAARLLGVPQAGSPGQVDRDAARRTCRSPIRAATRSPRSRWAPSATARSPRST